MALSREQEEGIFEFLKESLVLDSNEQTVDYGSESVWKRVVKLQLRNPWTDEVVELGRVEIKEG